MSLKEEDYTTDNFVGVARTSANLPKVKTVIMYVDTFLALVCPTSSKQAINQSVQNQYLSSVRYKVPTSSKDWNLLEDTSFQLNSMYVPDVRLLRPNEADPEDPDPSVDPAEQPAWVNNLQPYAPEGHEWVSLLDISNYTNCRNECFIAYVDGTSSRIGEFANAESEYARFTGYWQVGSHLEYNSNQKDIIAKDTLDHTIMLYG